MYSDRKKHYAPLVALCAAALAALIALFAWGSRASAREIAEQSAAAVKAAVTRSALQCYVVEGVYPPDLAYLEEHYGLRLNRDDYYITYDAFASNLPPDVRVTPKAG